MALTDIFIKKMNCLKLGSFRIQSIRENVWAVVIRIDGYTCVANHFISYQNARQEMNFLKSESNVISTLGSLENIVTFWEINQGISAREFDYKLGWM